MKKVVIISLALIFGLLFTSACSKSEASKYSDVLYDQHLRIAKKILALVKVFKEGKPLSLSKRLRELKVETDKAVIMVNEMEGYKGDTELRDAYQENFDFYQSIVDNEYTELVGMLEERNTAFSHSDVEYIQRMQETLNDREEPLDEDLKIAIKAFEDKYSVSIDRSDLEKAIRRITRQ